MIKLKRAYLEEVRVGPELSDDIPIVEYISLFGWQEHCTECGAPQCFYTCDLYLPGNDLYCRRFKNGIEISKKYSTVKKHSYKIIFKPMSLFLTQGTILLLPKKWIEILEKNYAKFYWMYDFLTRITSVFPFRVKLHFFYYFELLINTILKKLNACRRHFSKIYPDTFRIDIYNPNNKVISCSLWIRNVHFVGQKVEFNKVFNLNPGFNHFLININDIKKFVDFDLLFTVSFAPNETENILLYICCFDFVKHKEIAKRPVKCLIIDLDNTLWDGILLEKIPEMPKLKKGFLKVIEELDKRGILLSIASKNNYEESKRVLEKIGVWKYFLYPKINWDPKSENLIRIAKDLNIGIDSLAFIDDSLFELEEVKVRLPHVLCVHADDYLKIPGMEQFKGDVSPEAGSRRKMYMEGVQRRKVRSTFVGNYEKFLKSCNITVTIFLPVDKVIARIQDLVQRTNQLNFSMHRYTKEELQRLIEKPSPLTLAVRVQDKFGDYGIAGFNILSIEGDRAVLRDAMFSCRIQAKRIEHAVFMKYITACKNSRIKKFYIKYVETDRNQSLIKILDDINFKLAKVEGKSRLYVLNIEENELPEIDFIKVTEPVSIEDMIKKMTS